MRDPETLMRFLSPTTMEIMAKVHVLLQKKWDVEIHANFETCARLGLDPVNQCRVFESLERRDLGPDLSMLPIPIPHDDAETWHSS
uniref:Uncharacterized protein n=1 Tax=uncultured archaeon MedDCM-OCT-S05-C10 TaxID=743088 RepID=D6PBE4_9ARCH|nr:hypothetical protein [uncultured archaeon MedDCM-OCT-S05-C10]